MNSKLMNIGKREYLQIVGLLVCVITLMFSQNITAAEIGAGVLNNSARLSLSRNNAKQMQQIKVEDYMTDKENNDGNYDGGSSDCGSIDIGNVEESRPGLKSNKKVEIFVIGDIISNSDCK